MDAKDRLRRDLAGAQREAGEMRETLAVCRKHAREYRNAAQKARECMNGGQTHTALAASTAARQSLDALLVALLDGGAE